MRAAWRVILFGLVVAVTPAAVAGRSTEQVVAPDLGLRTALHFPSGAEYVRALLSDPTTMWYGSTPLTPAEYEELEARLALELDAAAIEQYFGDDSRELAGLYLDHAAGGLLVVLMAKGSMLPGPLLARIGQPSRVVVRNATNSLFELTEVRQAIRDAIARNEPGTRGIRGVSVDERHNTVRVVFDGSYLVDGRPPAEFRQRFESAGEIISTEAEGAALVAASLQFDPTSPPIKGGNGFGASNDPSCTAAFKVWKGDETTAYMITAGHCIDQMPFGTLRYHRNVIVGTTAQVAYGGNYDFGLVKLGNNNKMVSQIYYGTGAVETFPVVGTNTTYTVGLIRCFTGAFSGQSRCGDIIDNDFDGPVFDPGLGQNIQHTNLVVVDAQCIPGDSGSPVYRFSAATEEAWASGVLSACSGFGGDMAYHRWSHIPPGWELGLAGN